MEIDGSGLMLSASILIDPEANTADTWKFDTAFSACFGWVSERKSLCSVRMPKPSFPIPSSSRKGSRTALIRHVREHQRHLGEHRRQSMAESQASCRKRLVRLREPLRATAIVSSGPIFVSTKHAALKLRLPSAW